MCVFFPHFGKWLLFYDGKSNSFARWSKKKRQGVGSYSPGLAASMVTECSAALSGRRRGRSVTSRDVMWSVC